MRLCSLLFIYWNMQMLLLSLKNIQNIFSDCPHHHPEILLLPFTSLTGDTVRHQAAPILWVVGPLRTWKLSGRSSAGRAVVASWTFILQKRSGIFGTEEPGWKTEEKGRWGRSNLAIFYLNNDLMVAVANLTWLLHCADHKKLMHITVLSLVSSYT